MHPALLEAAHYIASAVRDEARKFAASTTSANSSALSNIQNNGHSYGLESDDEEMAGDSSQSSDSTGPSLSRSNSNLNAQLLNALARSERSGVNQVNNGMNLSNTTSQSSNSNNSGVITFEMFYQAMQQAFASNPGANNPGNSTSSLGAQSNTTNAQNSLALMHEMGLSNDAINLQALQVTNGDVQAAIDLVLNGFGDN